MKKIFLSFFVLSLLVGGVPTVHAQALSGAGGPCTNDNGCSGDLFCNVDATPHVCQALGAAGAHCANDNQCTADLFCNTTVSPHVCAAGTVDATAEDAPATLSDQNAGGASNNSDTGFVSLTKIPLFDQAGNAATLSVFLNAVYKICIGLAAVLAVLQIMRAGVMYMGGDSVTEKSAARGLIRDSLLGLLLVLAPAIVFGVINPKILSLQIGGLDSLRVTNVGPAGSATPAGGTTPTPQNVSGSTLETQNAAQCQNYPNRALFSAGSACSSYGDGYTSIPATCCEASDSSFICCGKPR